MNDCNEPQSCSDSPYVQGPTHCKLRVVNLRVRSLSVDYNELYWDVLDTMEDVLDYTFQVLRSEAAMGPWEELGPELEDQYVFVDNKVKVANIYRQWHYLLRVKHKASGETQDVGPVLKAPEPDLVALELRRHLNVLFSEFNGRKCWVLPARTMGQRCGDCWNPKLEKRIKSGCRTCYDTGFVRGYHRPIEVWVQFDPSPKNEQPSTQGRLQQTSTTAKMSAFPPLKPDDLIVEGENNRWQVRTVSTTQQGRAPVLQSLELHLVPPTDIEYLIPLHLCQPLKDVSFNPTRNYVNPQNLTNDREREVDFPLVYQLYPTSFPAVK